MHTGQNYDHTLNGIFFRDLELDEPEAFDKACFILAGIDEDPLLQAMETAVKMNENGDFRILVPDYTEEKPTAR